MLFSILRHVSHLVRGAFRLTPTKEESQMKKKTFKGVAVNSYDLKKRIHFEVEAHDWEGAMRQARYMNVFAKVLYVENPEPIVADLPQVEVPRPKLRVMG